MNFTFAHNNINVKNLEESIAFYQEALGLRESAVQTRLLRARQKLRQKLEGWNDD